MPSPSLIRTLSQAEHQEFLDACLPLAGNHIKLAEKVRTQYSYDESAEIISILIARSKAKPKFSKWDRMFFTDELLEQSTSETVSLFKGEHYFSGTECADLCCGAGGSLIGMAASGKQAVGCDIDPGHLSMAEANLNIYGLSSNISFIQADITERIPEAAVYHFDPSRRTVAGREYLPDNYLPPLSTVDSILDISPDIAVKVSPLHSVAAEGEYSCDVISCNGEVKEILLCYGRFNTGQVRAIVLPRKTILTAEGGSEADISDDIGTYVFEPDPAVVKAGLVTTAAASMGLDLIASGVRYLTGNSIPDSSVCKTYKVREIIPFNYKKLNRYLKGTEISTIDVKCKDSTVKPVSITKKLKTRRKGSERVSLFYIEKDDGNRIFILAERIGV